LPGKAEKGYVPKRNKYSVINITEERVVIPTPLIMIEELPEDVTPDTAEKHMVQIMQRKNKEPMQERLKKSLCIEHLNEEEKEALEQICEKFCDTFYLEDDMLTCTSYRMKLIRVPIARR